MSDLFEVAWQLHALANFRERAFLGTSVNKGKEGTEALRLGPLPRYSCCPTTVDPCPWCP
jgi:hypothetical protein